MYAAVNARAVEIVTLRAFGFGATGVVVSVLIEAPLLAMLGALLGAEAVGSCSAATRSASAAAPVLS